MRITTHPPDDAQNTPVLLCDVCEILGSAVLTWVTGVVYGEGETASPGAYANHA